MDRPLTELGLDSMLAEVDLVVTGEGRFDATSMAGKVVGGVWRRTTTLQIPLVAVVGVQDPSAGPPHDMAVLSLSELYGPSRAWNDAAGAIADAVALYLSTACSAPGR